MKSATLTVTTPFLLAPAARPARQARKAQFAAPASGLFARLDRETAAGSLPETLVFGLLAITGAAWPTWEAFRLIFAF